MNERLMRIGGKHCAEFVTAFEDTMLSPKAGVSPLDNDIWLVWKYEGNNTLFDLMEKKNEFPYNMETLLFGRELKLPKGPRRKMVTIRLIVRQLLEALKACHGSGENIHSVRGSCRIGSCRIISREILTAPSMCIKYV